MILISLLYIKDSNHKVMLNLRYLCAFELKYSIRKQEWFLVPWCYSVTQNYTFQIRIKQAQFLVVFLNRTFMVFYVTKTKQNRQILPSDYVIFLFKTINSLKSFNEKSISPVVKAVYPYIIYYSIILTYVLRFIKQCAWFGDIISLGNCECFNMKLVCFK